MSADAGTVHLEVRGTTAVVTFDRPAARNAMTWAMYEQLDQALDKIASDTTLRVALLRGSGGNFVAGTDIAQFANFETADDGIYYEQQLEAVVSKLESQRVTTVAAVEGTAAGGGLALASVCDLRICTPDARFGVPIARTVGNCLSMANYARLVANLGVARTKQLLFTAEFMPASEALALGFVTAVVAPEVFDAQAEELCARLAEHAPVTLQVTKDAIRRIVSRSIADGEELTRRAYGSRDFHEGVAAFLEKRAPRWEGR